MQGTPTQEQNSMKWAWRVAAGMGLCVLFALAGDLIIVFSEGAALSQEVLQSNLRRYILLPYAAALGLVLLTAGATWALGRRKRFSLLAMLQITAISLVCGVFAWANQDTTTIYLLYLLPLIFSLIYIRRSVSLWAFALNVALYSLHWLLHGRGEGPGAQQAVSISTMYIILAVVFFISMLVLIRLRELMQTTREAQNLARRDSLTGLLNHATFYEHLDQHIQESQRTRAPFSLVVLDIDDFKAINDQRGHDVGDQAILALVDAIDRHTRQELTAFRYGGEEFALLFWGEAQPAVSLAEKILAEFEKKTRRELSLPVTASAGVSQYDAGRFSGRREFFASADEALYQAKRQGKNCCVLWLPQ